MPRKGPAGSATCWRSRPDDPPPTELLTKPKGEELRQEASPLAAGRLSTRRGGFAGRLIKSAREVRWAQGREGGGGEEEEEGEGEGEGEGEEERGVWLPLVPERYNRMV